MKYKDYELLDNGRLDDTNLKSEYERGYVDCWNDNVSQWARCRTEEPLKGYREWVMLGLWLKT